MRRKVLLLSVALGTLLALILYLGTKAVPIDLVTPHGEGVIYIDNIPLDVMVADTPAARTQGLSGRAPLSGNQGVFFVFDEADRYGFWMKDMRFAIDIIWLSDEGFVLEIDENVSPESYPKVFKPDVPARYVLEVRAGFVRENGIRPGSKISF
jgi:uncharacterized membrane protein (UPF0127 family)